MTIKIKEPTHCGHYKLSEVGRHNATKMKIAQEVRLARARNKKITRIIIYRNSEPIREQAKLI